jgi:hypothetical protein
VARSDVFLVILVVYSQYRILPHQYNRTPMIVSKQKPSQPPVDATFDIESDHH